MRPLLFVVVAIAAVTHAVTAQNSEVDSVRTAWFDRAGAPGGAWAGGDVGASVLLPDGQSVWTWGDTFYGGVNPDGTLQPGWRFVQGNALTLTTSTGALTSIFGSGPSSLVKPATPGNWLWMADATLDQERLRVFMNEFYRTGSGMWDFAWTGRTWIASFTWSGLESVDLAPGSGNGIAWGSAIMEEWPYFYIYGDEEVPIPGFGNFHRVHVARVLQSAGLFGQWTYFSGLNFNGSSWVTNKNRSQALTLLGTRDNFCHVNGVRRLPDGRYGMLSMLFPGETIDEYYATSPEGPWGNKTVLYRPPETGVGNQFSYMARYHPQFDSGSKTSIGYSVNGGTWGTNFYRPRFILVDR